MTKSENSNTKIPFVLTRLFTEFFNSEKGAGFILIGCTIVSLLIANSGLGEQYQQLWSSKMGGLTVAYWINDALMAVFFLLVGLEIERELYVGELSKIKNAMLPVMAAIGGMMFPALLHFIINAGSATANGYAIPMATDIAFALGILSLAGKRVPTALKIFITEWKSGGVMLLLNQHPVTALRSWLHFRLNKNGTCSIKKCHLNE